MGGNVGIPITFIAILIEGYIGWNSEHAQKQQFLTCTNETKTNGLFAFIDAKAKKVENVFMGPLVNVFYDCGFSIHNKIGKVKWKIRYIPHGGLDSAFASWSFLFEI